MKLADFGFSKLMKQNESLKTVLGTEAYMAPEIVLQRKYDGKAVDLFAAAIVLFIMYSGTPAFGQALPADPYYKLLCIGKQSTFWRAHCRNKPGKRKFFSKPFKDLITKMLSFNQEDRLTLEEITQHDWFRGPTLTAEDIKYEFD